MEYFNNWYESKFEGWLFDNPKKLGKNVMVVGRQIRYGIKNMKRKYSQIDLICKDKSNKLILVEVKYYANNHGLNQLKSYMRCHPHGLSNVKGILVAHYFQKGLRKIEHKNIKFIKVNENEIS